MRFLEAFFFFFRSLYMFIIFMEVVMTIEYENVRKTKEYEKDNNNENQAKTPETLDRAMKAHSLPDVGEILSSSKILEEVKANLVAALTNGRLTAAEREEALAAASEFKETIDGILRGNNNNKKIINEPTGNEAQTNQNIVK